MLYQKIPLNDEQPLDLIKTLIRIAREAGLKDIDFDIKKKPRRLIITLPAAIAKAPVWGQWPE